MNKPPESTLIFTNIPSNTTNWLIGIDTKFITVNQILKGIKLIPKGVHLVHYSLPSINKTPETSIRYGTWIDFDNEVIVFSWNSEIEKFHVLDGTNPLEALNYSKDVNELGDIYPYTIAYPEDKTLWHQLTSYLDMELLQEFLPFQGYKSTTEVTTLTASKEENMVLLDHLHTRDDTRHYDNANNVELKYTIIDWKLNKPNTHNVAAISANYLDKSWYLEKVYGHDRELMLGELQLSFVMFVVLGNYCSGLAWLNVLKLISMSKTFLWSNKTINIGFLDTFRIQLETLPVESVGDISSITGVDSETFILILENFHTDIYFKLRNPQCCSEMKVDGIINNKWDEILNIVTTKFGISLRELETEMDENNFEIYKLDNNDEDGPTVVGDWKGL